MISEHARTARIEARIAPDVLSLVKQAAEMQGRSVSGFVVSAAQEAAHRAIEEAQIIRLSAEDQRRFVELLLNAFPAILPSRLHGWDASPSISATKAVGWAARCYGMP